MSTAGYLEHYYEQAGRPRAGRRNYKGHEETLAGDGFVNYLDCGDDLTAISTCQTH